MQCWNISKYTYWSTVLYYEDILLYLSMSNLRSLYVYSAIFQTEILFYLLDYIYFNYYCYRLLWGAGDVQSYAMWSPCAKNQMMKLEIILKWERRASIENTCCIVFLTVWYSSHTFWCTSYISIITNRETIHFEIRLLLRDQEKWEIRDIYIFTEDLILICI